MGTGSALADAIRKAREDKKRQEEEDKKRREAEAKAQAGNHGIGYGSQQSHPTPVSNQHADWYKPIVKHDQKQQGPQQAEPQIPKWQTNVKVEVTKDKQDNNHSIGYGSQPSTPTPISNQHADWYKPLASIGPQMPGPQIPQWRANTGPVDEVNKPMGPAQPGPMMPLWKAPTTPVMGSFGDRESMDSAPPSYASQVGFSVPRVNTGPTQIGASQITSPTVDIKPVQPWRPDAVTQPGLSSLYKPPATPQPGLSSIYRPQSSIPGALQPQGMGNAWMNTEGQQYAPATPYTPPAPEKDNWLTDAGRVLKETGNDIVIGLRDYADEAASGIPSRTGAARIGYPVALPGRTDEPISNAFVDSAAYERMQNSFDENAVAAGNTTGIGERIGNWWEESQKRAAQTRGNIGGEIDKWRTGEQGIGSTLYNIGNLSYEAEHNAVAAPNLTDAVPLMSTVNQYAGNALAARQALQDWINLQDTSKLTGYDNSTVGSTLASATYGTAEGLGNAVYNMFTGKESKSIPAVTSSYGVDAAIAGYNQSMQAYTNATRSPDRTKDDNANGLPENITPEQIKRNRERAMLNWADPASVEKTFSQLNDKDLFAQQGQEVAQQLTAQAQQETDPQKRAKLMADAADAGAAAYHAAHDSPMAIVNANTNFWKQLPLEILEPDITSVIGQIFEVAHLTPKERRLASTAKSVMVDEAAARKAIESIPVVAPTEKIASVVKPSGHNPLTNLGTTGQARAVIDSAEIHKVVATLLADADTTADARVLLTQLARDPKQLIDGMDANLFQSPGLVARADADGKVRFGSMGLNTENVQRALNSYRSIADEFLANAGSLNSDGMVNKIDLMSDVSEATAQGGYRYYNVANDAGKAPYGETQRVRVKTLSGGEAYIEYVGKDGKVLKTGDKTTLLDANRQATALNKTLKKGGKLTDDSLIKKIGDVQRRIVSPMYITLTPGTWETNITNFFANMFSDKTWTGATAKQMEEHETKLFGGIKSTRRSMEGVETAGGFAGNSGLLGPLKKAYGKVEEWGANKTAYSSMTHALQTYGPQVLEDAFRPVLEANGITDPKLIKQINNRLFEVGYMGGDMQAELANIITGNSKPFSVSDVNKHYLESVPADKLEEFYGILKSSPDTAVVSTKLDDFFDRMRHPWEEAVQGSPPVPQRHSWMKTEVQQDMADFAQVGNTVVKNGGMTAEEAKAAQQTQLAAQKAIDQKMSALTDMVKDATDPSKRYVLYDTWGQIRDKTNDVRATQAEAVERAYSLGTPEAWKEYHATMDAAWKSRNEFAESVLNNAATALHGTAEVAPNLSFWDRLERTAKVSESKLYETLRMEPQSGRWDSRLGQVIEAGRSLVDKKVSEVFAAARRFGGASVMDEIVSAEKSAEIAGAQANLYVRNAAEKAAKTGKWDNFYSIRNEVYRQMRAYEATVWDIAKRNIIEEGLAMESKGGGKTFDFMGEQVELVGQTEKDVLRTDMTGPKKVTGTEKKSYWQIRHPDGKISEIAASQIPEEIKAAYSGLKPADIEAELQMEMDNIASAQPFAKDAQSMIDMKQEGATVWRSPEGDKPVKITGVSGEKDGVTYYSIEGGGEIPETELYEVTKNKKLRKVTDSDAMRSASETMQMSAAEVEAAKEALATMRREWDRIARGQKGYLKLENAVGVYFKDGISQVPENKFEDLYGVNIAGRAINNQWDIDKFLEEYADLRKQVETQKRIGEAARGEYVRLHNAEVDPEVIRRELNLGSQSTVGEKWDSVARDTSRNTTAAGATRPPEIALAANHALEQLESWRRYMKENLADILAPSGKMGDAQAFNVMNEFKKTVLPAWDNVKFTAAEFADRMRSFTHIDFRNQTRLDEFLGLGTPYSFYYTRAAKNALERMVFEPQVWSRISKIEKGIKDMREQNGDPTRFDGAIPITIGGATHYIRITPSKYWPLFQNFFSNNYADPESANSNFGYAVESMQAMGFGVFPWIDVAKKYAEGRSQDISIPSYAPQGKIIAWGALKNTGYNNQIPHALLPQNYEYNVGRELTNMVAEGKITQEQALYARDFLEQQKNGGQPLPGQTLTPELKKILDEASDRAANVQLTQGVSSYLTGVSDTPYNTAERDTLEAKRKYKERGYDPITNPYGSKEAKNATFGEYPQLGNAFAQSNLFYPDSVRSGAVADNTAKRKEAEKLYADMNKAAEAYLQSHPEADKQELNAIKAPFYDQINALDKKYPNAAAPEGSGGPPKGMNPAERAQYELDGILKKTAENKPEYPVNGTPQQIKDYYLALNKFTPEQRASVERSLNGLLAMDETEYPGISQWKGELKKLVGNQYASEIIRYDSVRRASATEQDWSSRMAVVQELKDTERQAAQGRIVKEMGQTAYDNMQAYYALPKGGEERKQFAKEHPEVERAIMLAYNPTQYEQAKKIFGDNVWNIYYDPKRPEYPGKNASETEMKAYYAKLDAYNKANPRSEEIRLWVNGRSRPEGASGGTVGGPVSLSGIDSHQQIAQTPQYNDFGTDWAEARRIFGRDIFKTVANFPQTDDKKVIGRYLGQHPELTGYWEWKKDLAEHPERAPQRGYTYDVPSQTLRDAVQGQPRPLGSGAQPIGSTSAPTGAPDMQFDNHGIGYGAQTPLSTSSATAPTVDLPSTTAASTSSATVSPMAPDGTPMDMLDYARQDPKFVKREAMNAEFAKRDAALTKQFGADSVSLYSQYHDLPKDSDARKKFLAEHPEVRQMDAWLYGRSAGRDKDSKAPPSNYGADYEEAKKRFGDHIWDLYGQYDKDWSKAQKKAFFNEHPEYSGFLDFWYGDDGKGGGTYHRKVPGGHVRHGQNRGKGKRRGGYWLGQWYIDENGVAHLGGPDGPVGKGPAGFGEDSSGGDAPQMIGAPENNGPTQSAPQMIGTPENNGPGGVPATLQELQMIAAPTEAPIPSRPTQGGAPVGGYWLGNYFIDTQGVAHEGGPNGPVASFDTGKGSYRSYQPYQRTAYVDPQSMLSDLRVGENDIRPWRPDWTSRGWMNAGQELRPEQLRPWRSPRNY